MKEQAFIKQKNPIPLFLLTFSGHLIGMNETIGSTINQKGKSP